MKKFFTLFTLFFFVASLQILQAQTSNSLYGWGANGNGQLGDGTFPKQVPYQSSEATDWLSISSGDSHNLAIKANGSLWAWGSNQYGQLGDGTIIDNSSIVQIGDATDWVSASAGYHYNLAIKADGTLWAWGWNEYGMLGDGSTTDRHEPVQIGTDTDWASVSAGGKHSLATKADGTLWAWGRNNYGQLGDGMLGSTSTPFQIGIATDWNIVSAGSKHSLATKADGSLWAWGSNQTGEIGDGTTIRKYEPVQIGSSTDWSFVTAGKVNSGAIKTDGTLWTWGANFWGQLGDGTTTDRHVPVQIGTSTDWSSIFLEFGYSIGLKTDGTLWAWGVGYPGELGVDSFTENFEPVQIGTATEWSFVSAGNSHNIAIKNDGTLWAWGSNSVGQLGDGKLFKHEPYQTGDAVDWALVSVKTNFSLALKKDGTLWAWGKNNFGQLGNGTGEDAFTPIQIGVATDWSSISAGSNHSMAIKKDGSLWGWGVNGNGQLGDGTTTNKNEPVQIGSSTDWASVAVGAGHTLALKKDGTIWAWGYNGAGQIGDGTTTDKNEPVKIGTSTDWSSISIGLYHNVALKKDGTLWAWGSNFNGQLGNGTTTEMHEPVQIGTATDWVFTSSGQNFTFGIKADGTLWGWGDNSSGQLGNGTLSSNDVPVQIGVSTDWNSVFSGNQHALGKKKDGTLWAWGANRFGQLGDGTTTRRQSPVQIGSSTDWFSIVVGPSFTMAILVEPNPFPDLHSPQPNSYSSKNIAVDFTLPEAAQAGSVQLTFTGSGGEEDVNAPHVITLDASFEAAAQHTLTLDGSDLSSSAGAATVNSAPNDALVSGAVYTVTLSYQDQESNPATAESTGFSFDTTSPEVLTKAVTLQLNASGTATLTSSAVDAGSIDNTTTQEELVFTLSKENYTCSEAGLHEITLTVKDQAGNSSSAIASVTVEDITAPIITAGQSFTVDENTASASVVGNIIGTDNCNIQSYSITAGNTADGFAIDADGSISVNTSSALDYETNQEFTLMVTATDEAGNSSEEAVSVKLSDVNDNAPELTVPAQMTGDELSKISFTATATDGDYEAVLAFSLDNAPEGASIDATTGVFSWISREDQGPETYIFSVIVSDGSLSDTQEISITVEEVNHAPVLTVPAQTTGDELSELTFTATATDQDLPAASLEFSLENAPEGAAIDAATGEFSWTPTEEQAPQTYTFSLIVSDGALGDTKELSITVEEVNQAPEIVSEPATSAREGEAYTYQLLAKDADLPENTLSYEALEIPSWLSLDASTQLLSGTPGKDAQESSLIRLQVSDGIESITQEFTLTVEILTGIFDRNSQQASQINLYPNPTHGAITLSLGDEIAGEIIGLSLLDLSGRQLLQKQGSLERGMKKVNDYLQHAKAGVYLLELKRKDDVLRVKVVKE